MAIVWGALSKRAQLGIDLSMSPATVGPSTSSVTLTWTVYLRTTYAYAGTYGLQRTGTGPTGTTNVTFSTPNGQTTTVQIWQGTQTVSTSYTPGAVTRSLTATLPASGTLFDGAKPTVTRSFTVPTRPQGAPSAPTAASVTRISDTQHAISWTRPANWNTDGTKWASARVARSTNAGPWVDVATGIAPTTTSWTDTSTVANAMYRWEVYGVNEAGPSSGATTAYIETTPAAPSNVVATKTGTDIQITWTDNTPGLSLGHVTWEIYDNDSLLDDDLPHNQTTYPHTNPSAVQHIYTVRAKTVHAPTLYSAFGTSNTVTTIAPPDAPTLIAPVGTTEAVGPVTFVWQHNPVDSSVLTGSNLRYRVLGSGSWTTVDRSSSSSSTYTFTPSFAGNTIEWQAQTKGSHANFGPWSGSAVFQYFTRPVATLVAPGATLNTSTTTIEWGFAQAQGQNQSAWEVEVLLGSSRVWSASGTGSAPRTVNTPAIFGNGQTYTVRVRVREPYGLWSAWASRSVSVSYTPPAEPQGSAQWHAEGYVLVTGVAVDDPPLPATVDLRLERSVNGGPFVVLAESLGLEFSFFDWTAPSVGHIEYRVVAISATPSEEFLLIPLTLSTSDSCDVYVSGGPGYAQVVRLRAGLTRQITAGRERVLNQFDGRSNPTSTSGPARPYTIAVSGQIVPFGSCGEDYPATTPQDFEAFAELPGTFLYRDYDGRWFSCHIDEVRIDPGFLGQVSFTVTRIDSPTAAVQTAMEGYLTPVLVRVGPGEYMVVGGATLDNVGPGEWGLTQ